MSISSINPNYYNQYGNYGYYPQAASFGSNLYQKPVSYVPVLAENNASNETKKSGGNFFSFLAGAAAAGVVLILTKGKGKKAAEKAGKNVEKAAENVAKAAEKTGAKAAGKTGTKAATAKTNIHSKPTSQVKTVTKHANLAPEEKVKMTGQGGKEDIRKARRNKKKIIDHQMKAEKEAKYSEQERIKFQNSLGTRATREERKVINRINKSNKKATFGDAFHEQGYTQAPNGELVPIAAEKTTKKAAATSKNPIKTETTTSKPASKNVQGKTKTTANASQVSNAAQEAEINKALKGFKVPESQAEKEQLVKNLKEELHNKQRNLTAFNKFSGRSPKSSEQIQKLETDIKIINAKLETLQPAAGKTEVKAAANTVTAPAVTEKAAATAAKSSKNTEEISELEKTIRQRMEKQYVFTNQKLYANAQHRFFVKLDKEMQPYNTKISKLERRWDKLYSSKKLTVTQKKQKLADLEKSMKQLKSEREACRSSIYDDYSNGKFLDEYMENHQYIRKAIKSYGEETKRLQAQLRELKNAA